MKTKVSPARSAALFICIRVRERNAFVHDLLHSQLDSFHLSEQDQSFATLLAVGVVHTYGTLDEIIDQTLRSPEDIQPRVRDALRISTYEIIFLDKSPYAAVDQGVELVRSIAPRAAGLANSVLRSVSKLRLTFPFGDPLSDIEAFARKYAFPPWIAAMLIQDLGREAAENHMKASNEPAPLFLAINPQKADDTDTLERLWSLYPDFDPVSIDGVRIPGSLQSGSRKVLRDERFIEFIQEGNLLIADAASQAVSYYALPDDPPDSFLEICSGRGTKTILLQSFAYRRYGSQLHLVSLDNQKFKTDILRQRCKTYGVLLDEILLGDACDLDGLLPERIFDVVFIDAPCSGLGTLRRHPEIRWRLTPETVQRCATKGLEILISAADHVSPGGLLVYATCTVTKRENEEVARQFMCSDKGQDFTLVSHGNDRYFSTRVCSGSADGHFSGIFRRKR